MTDNTKFECTHCGDRIWSDHPDAAAWNGEFKGGYLVGIRCPACQSPEQNAEAEINAATLDYGGADARRRLTATARV